MKLAPTPGMSVFVATQSSSTRSDASLLEEDAAPAVTLRSTSAERTCAAEASIDAAIESSWFSGILLILVLYDAVDLHGQPVLMGTGKHLKFFDVVDLRDERRGRFLVEEHQVPRRQRHEISQRYDRLP